MVSERQKIEAPPTPSAENYMAQPPPSYDEVNGMFASSSVDDSVTSVDFFLGEVWHSFHAKSIAPSAKWTWIYRCYASYINCLVVMMQALDSFKAESESELNLSAGDIVIVRKVIYLCCPCFVIFNWVADIVPMFLNTSSWQLTYHNWAVSNLMWSCPNTDINQWLGRRRMQGKSRMVPTWLYRKTRASSS